MSTTAGKRRLPSAGRCTSPTRLTPSLAGIVTSESVVSPEATPGAPRTSATTRRASDGRRERRPSRAFIGPSGLDAHLLGDAELLTVDRPGRDQRVAALLDALLELQLERLEAAERLRRRGAEDRALAAGRLELHLEAGDLLGRLDAEFQRLALLRLLRGT